VLPSALPNHATSSNDWQTEKADLDKRHVPLLIADVSRSKYDHNAKSALRELKQNRLESCKAKGADDERPKRSEPTVHGIACRNHNENEPKLEVSHGFPDLGSLKLVTSHARLPLTQSFHSDDTFFCCEEPGGGGRVRKEEANTSISHCDAAEHNVEDLPVL